MGCICSKSSENSNVNLDPIKISNRKNKNEDSTNKKENTNNYTIEDALNASVNKNANMINNVDNIIIANEEEKAVQNIQNNINQNQINIPNKRKSIDKNIEIKKEDINEEFVRLVNEFRSNPAKLADMLISEIKNISVNITNGKELILYKGIYCINGKDELFLKVSDALRSLIPMDPLAYKKDLEIEIKQIPSTKGLSNEEKKKIQRENDEDIKNKYKILKETHKNLYKKFEILPHTMNENIIDSIIMQIVSNFNENKTVKVKRPFDIIFNKDFKYIGLSLIGKKKMSGSIIFAA